MQGVSHRGQRSLKLVGSSRGEGVFRSADGEAAVSYQADTFEERNRTSISGSLVGDLGFATDKTTGSLSLATGEEIKIVLVKPDDEGADFHSA